MSNEHLVSKRWRISTRPPPSEGRSRIDAVPASRPPGTRFSGMAQRGYDNPSQSCQPLRTQLLLRCAMSVVAYPWGHYGMDYLGMVTERALSQRRERRLGRRIFTPPTGLRASPKPSAQGRGRGGRPRHAGGRGHDLSPRPALAPQRRLRSRVEDAARGYAGLVGGDACP